MIDDNSGDAQRVRNARHIISSWLETYYSRSFHRVFCHFLILIIYILYACTTIKTQLIQPIDSAILIRDDFVWNWTGATDDDQWWDILAGDSTEQILLHIVRQSRENIVQSSPFHFKCQKYIDIKSSVDLMPSNFWSLPFSMRSIWGGLFSCLMFWEYLCKI